MEIEYWSKEIYYFVGAESVAAESINPQLGQKIYRVWGDEASPYGRSWTRTDPDTIPNYRNEAGLPNENTGRFVSEGTLSNLQGVEQRSAIPLYDNICGLDEVVVPDPEEKIELENVSGMNPPF